MHSRGESRAHLLDLADFVKLRITFGARNDILLRGHPQRARVIQQHINS
jgi:hypothetical protein